MKKQFALASALLAVTVGVCGLFAGCNDPKEPIQPEDPSITDGPAPAEETPAKIGLYLPDGTPMLAVTELVANGLQTESATIPVETTIVSATDIAKVFATYSDCDMAIMPTVSAATIYSKGTEVQMFTANVFGNLFIVGVGGAKSLADLKGKTVYTTTGTTVAMMQYLLEKNDIPYELGESAKEGVVTLISKSAASDYLPYLVKADAQAEVYGIFGEPAVTNCLLKAPNAEIMLDLQEEYKKITGEEGYPQASLIVRKSFAEAHPKLMETLAAQLAKNIDYLNDNLDALQSFFAEQGSTTLSGISYTADTIARCNLNVVTAANIKEAVLEYLDGMRAAGVAVGEVDDGFFYTVK